MINIIYFVFYCLNRLITNELLYQLSYIGTKRKIIAERSGLSQKVRSGKSTHLRSVLLR